MMAEARKKASEIIAKAKKDAADRKADVTAQAESNLKQAEEQGAKIEAEAREQAEDVKAKGEAEVKKVEDACQNNKASVQQMSNMLHSSLSLLALDSDAHKVDRTLATTQSYPSNHVVAELGGMEI